MDLSKLKYSKADSAKEIRAESKTIPKPTEEKNADMVHLPDIPYAYTKGEGVLSTSLIFVLSGGEKREKDFLKELIKNKTIRSLRVAFMSEKGQGLQPYQMQERWNAVRSAGIITISGISFHLESMDKVFMLTDVDEFYDQLLKIDRNASPEWIISNPCFEMWLYYCYLNEPERDLGKLLSLDVSQRGKQMKSLCNELVAGGMNPLGAFERMTDGIRNSTAHYSIDGQGIPVLFATDMHKMAQYLIDTMNNSNREYDEYVRKKAEWRKMMSRRK